MRKTMIYLQEQQHDSLNRRSQATGRSLADLIREAVDHYLEDTRESSPDLSFIGAGVGPDDGGASEHDEEMLRELLR